MLRKAVLLGLAVIAILFIHNTSHAQFESGSVGGTVKDSSGAIIPGATVELRNLATNVPRNATANGAGEFDFVNVTPGNYKVTGRQPGFAELQRAVEVTVGQRSEVVLALAPGSAATVVEVNADSTLIDTASSDIGNLTTRQQVVDLPLNSRNFTQLVSLSPGVNLRGNSNNSQSLGYTSGRGANGAVVNGNPGEDTIFLFDGIQSVNNDIAAVIFFPPIDTIQEFKVQTSGAPAAYGGAPSIINVGFRSGGSRYHGTVYEFLRNSAFDSKNYFDSHANPIVPFHLNQFGGNFGGPMKLPYLRGMRDKLFFFADYEGKRVDQAQTYISTVPTPAFQNGDFTLLGKTLTLPGTTTPLPGNQVTMAQADPIAEKLIKLFPLPNYGAAGAIVNNYLYNPKLLNNIDQGDVRVDFRTDKTSAFARFDKENPITITPGYLPAPAIGGGPSRPGTTPIPSEQIVLGYGRSIGGSKYYEARLGWSRMYEKIVIENQGLGALSSQYGIPNANVGGFPGLTNFSITSQVGLGDGYGNLGKVDNNWELNQAFSFIKGKHEVKVGFDYQSRRQAKQDPLYPVGHFAFTGIYTGYGLADFLFGHSANSEIDTTPFTSLHRFTPSVYAQDSWRLTPKLTVNYGLRDDLVTPWRERSNRIAGFVPTGSGAVVPVGQAPFQNGVITDGRYDNFGPRLGVAYALDSKTVLRAGFGMYYAFENISSGQAEVANAPFAGSYTTTSASGLAGYQAAPTISGGFPTTYPLANSTITYYPRSYKNSVSNEYNMQIERQITPDDVLSVSYVGQTAAHVLIVPNINQPVPGSTSISSRRLYPNFAAINEICQCANSAFNSLQVSFRSRIAKTLDLLGSYTYGHSIDDSSGTGNVTGIQEPLNFGQDYRGNSDFDIRHAASVSLTYTLPIGRGQHFFKNIGQVPNLLVGGWQLNSIQTYQTGIPFTPTLITSLLNNGGGVQYPDRIGSGKLANPTPTHWFDLSAFACPGTNVPVPANGCVGPNYTYGNSGRNILFGPGTTQVDLSGFKNFIFSHDGSRYVQIRGEAFNIFNHPQFNNPNAQLGGAAAGTITSAGTPLLFQRTSRQIQVAAKLYF